MAGRGRLRQLSFSIIHYLYYCKHSFSPVENVVWGNDWLFLAWILELLPTVDRMTLILIKMFMLVPFLNDFWVRGLGVGFYCCICMTHICHESIQSRQMTMLPFLVCLCLFVTDSILVLLVFSLEARPVCGKNSLFFDGAGSPLRGVRQ